MERIGRSRLRAFFFPRFKYAVSSAFFLLAAILPLRAQPINLSRATVLTPADADGPEKAAIRLLVDEVAKRTGISWRVVPDWTPMEPVMLSMSTGLQPERASMAATPSMSGSTTRGRLPKILNCPSLAFGLLCKGIIR